jgi:hypothetical protein
MKEYIFNEKASIEAMMANGAVDEVNINKTIKKLARYNYYVLCLNDDDNYNEIVKYMDKNCAYFSEVGSYSDIKGCIRDASKSAWKDIREVIITKSELEFIQSLDDIRYEKLAFVLLADAKYDNAFKNKKINLSYLSNSDLYRLARVTMPIKDRSMFLHFLYEKELVEVNINPTTTHKKLLYVSEQDDEVGLVLTENNYKELAFTYMNWKSGGYKECKSCGALFRVKANSQYCKKCSPKYKTIEYKKIVCIDCCKEVYVNPMDSKACRCEECQHSANKINTRARVQKYRELHNM